MSRKRRSLKKTLPRKRKHLTVEALEARCLLAASVVNGIWAITGTAGDDAIAVARDAAHPSLLDAFINGQVVDRQREIDILGIRIDGGGGNDALRIDESNGTITTQATLLGGDGNDTLVGGAERDWLYGGNGTDTLLGMGGDDVLVGNGTLDGGAGKNVLYGGGTLSNGQQITPPTSFGSADAFKQYLIDTALEQYKDLFGKHFPGYNYYLQPYRTANVPAGAVTALDAANPSATTTVAQQQSQNPTFSQTNVQVAGVDEGDIVKTDGRFIYDLSRQELVILDSGSVPGPTPRIVSRTKLDGDPIAMYLDGDRLTVIAGQYDYYPIADAQVLVRSADGLPLVRVSSAKVRVTVLDVSDHTQPKTVDQTILDGSYQDSRMVGHEVYVVVTNYFAGLPAPAYINFNGETDYETKDSYLARVNGHEFDLSLPHYYTENTDGTLQIAGLVSDPATIYKPGSKDDYNLFTVLAIDDTQSNTQPTSAASVFGSYGSAVYSSLDHLYLAQPHWNYDGTSSFSSSTLVEFNLDGGTVSLIGTGLVPGQVLNQFSMDEQGDFFRIATTGNWGSNATNSLYVLTNESGVLTPVGSFEGLAKGQSLQAVRFLGDEAILTTYLNIDPLFGIDLKDATWPKEVGELHLPGTTSYLQPIDATHLIGIGHAPGWYGGLQLSLYDIATLSHPTLVAQYTINPQGWNWWTGSEAQWNHHAVGWFPEYDTLALPIYGTYSYSGANATYYNYVSSLYVFQVDPLKGFTLAGTISHDSQVRRSLRIGDQLYSIADDSVQVHPIANPQAQAADVRIYDDPRFPTYEQHQAFRGEAFTGEVLDFKITDATGLTATIDWGDQLTSVGVIAPEDGGRFTLSGTHTYAANGYYWLNIKFQRNGQDAGSLWSSINVVGRDDPRAFSFLPLSAGQNLAFTGTVATFAIGDVTDVTAKINWGDGASTDATLTSVGNGRYAVSGSHTFTSSGTFYYTVSLKRGVQDLGEFRSPTWISVIYVAPDSKQFLDQAYQDFFGRLPDDGGLLYWAQMLQNGVARPTVVQAFAATTEHRGRIVDAFYQQLLHRGADDSGKTFWSAYLLGHSTDDLRTILLGTPEYAATHGGADAGFLQALYQEVLHRDIDAAAQTAWLNALALGVSHSQVAAALIHSQEGMTNTVADLYQEVLHRSADGGGLEFFVRQMEHGVKAQDVAMAMAMAAEYGSET
jgi:inhibitor of cysteine peptidase